MTTKTIAPKQKTRRIPRFPEFPPRDDMQNTLYLHRYDIPSSLRDYLRRKLKRSAIVETEVPIGFDLSIRGRVRVPDMLVALNADFELLKEQGGYEITRQGNPPKLVLEVASRTTGIRDYTIKRRDYEGYGVGEYWRFDPSGGRYHDAALAGDRLVGGRYERIPIETLEDGSLSGYSETLGLYLRWEDGELRLYDPETRSYLSSYADEVERADREAAGRAAAEIRAREAETRMAELEEKIKRLLGE